MKTMGLIGGMKHVPNAIGIALGSFWLARLK